MTLASEKPGDVESVRSKILLPWSLRKIRDCEFPKKLGVMEFLYGRRLERYGRTWVTCSNGIDWILDLKDPTHRWIVYGDYEGSISLNWMRKWLQWGGVYVDSGANIGQMLLYLAPIDGVDVVAFEPVDESADWLEKCLRNQVGWKVKLLRCGLYSSNCELEMQMDGARSTLHGDWYGTKDLPRKSIIVKTLDSILSELNCDKVRLWKLDVEGAELEAVKGASRVLSDNSIDALHIETHPDNYQELRSLLSSFGYALFRLDSAGKLRSVQVRISITENLISVPT